MHIGEIIRKFRKEKKMTLLELSQKSGVALATLSRMENGIMTGTLKSHMNIAKALEVDFPELYREFSTSKKVLEVKSRKDHPDVFIHSKRASSEMLAANSLTKKMMPIMIRLSKGGATHKEETKPGIEKFVYLVDGKVEAIVGENKYAMVKGDTLYFESSLPHFFKNTSAGESRILSISSPPAV